MWQESQSSFGTSASSTATVRHDVRRSVLEPPQTSPQRDAREDSPVLTSDWMRQSVAGPGVPDPDPAWTESETRLAEALLSITGQQPSPR
jgi:hypothetical protein